MLRGIGTVVPIFLKIVNCQFLFIVKLFWYTFCKALRKHIQQVLQLIFDRDFEFQFNSQTSKIWRAFFTPFALYHGTVEDTLWKQLWKFL